MAFCPFMTANPGHVGGAVACLASCALNVEGHCAINILARVSLLKNEYHSRPADTQHQQKNDQSR